MDIPRRNKLYECTPAELAIYNAMVEVEKMDADVRLTDAVIKLQEAKELVADYVDGVNPPFKKKRVYIDMDGVLCNFDKASYQEKLDNPAQKFPQSKWGFFLKIEEIEDAVESLRKLEEKYDVWILTRPSFKNVNSFTEKAQWVWDHIGFDILEKTIMCGDKSLLKGDYLIDDMDGYGQSKFEGEWIKFGSSRFLTWKDVINYLMNI